MTGSRTLWRYHADSDAKATLSYSFSVTAGGKAKLVLVTPDGEVIMLAENTGNAENSEMQTQTVSLKKGRNRIKIVGHDYPEFELRLSIDAGQ
jgi:hypothetical protein